MKQFNVNEALVGAVSLQIFSNLKFNILNNIGGYFQSVVLLNKGASLVNLQFTDRIRNMMRFSANLVIIGLYGSIHLADCTISDSVLMAGSEPAHANVDEAENFITYNPNSNEEFSDQIQDAAVITNGQFITIPSGMIFNINF